MQRSWDSAFNHSVNPTFSYNLADILPNIYNCLTGSALKSAACVNKLWSDKYFEFAKVSEYNAYELYRKGYQNLMKKFPTEQNLNFKLLNLDLQLIKNEQLSDRMIAKFFWLDENASIDNDKVEVTNHIATYLAHRNISLIGQREGANSYCHAFLDSFNLSKLRINNLELGLKPGTTQLQFLESKFFSNSINLDVPIRHVTANKTPNGYLIQDTISQYSPYYRTENWDDISDLKKPEDYIFIVNLHGHYACACSASIVEYANKIFGNNSGESLNLFKDINTIKTLKKISSDCFKAIKFFLSKNSQDQLNTLFKHFLKTGNNHLYKNFMTLSDTHRNLHSCLNNQLTSEEKVKIIYSSYELTELLKRGAVPTFETLEYALYATYSTNDIQVEIIEVLLHAVLEKSSEHTLKLIFNNLMPALLNEVKGISVELLYELLIRTTLSLHHALDIAVTHHHEHLIKKLLKNNAKPLNKTLRIAINKCKHIKLLVKISDLLIEKIECTTNKEIQDVLSCLTPFKIINLMIDKIELTSNETLQEVLGCLNSIEITNLLSGKIEHTIEETSQKAIYKSDEASANDLTYKEVPFEIMKKIIAKMGEIITNETLQNILKYNYPIEVIEKLLEKMSEKLSTDVLNFAIEKKLSNEVISALLNKGIIPTDEMLKKAIRSSQNVKIQLLLKAGAKPSKETLKLVELYDVDQRTLDLLKNSA